MRPYPPSEFCPYLLDTVATPDFERRRWQDLVPPDPDPDPSEQPQRRSIWWTIVGGLILLFVLWRVLASLTPFTITNEIDVTRLVEVTIPPLPAVEVTVVETSPPEIQTVEVTSLATVLVPTVIVETALATRLVPVTVEVTPAPTATPTETPLPQTVEIIEDFDDLTLDPAFTVEGEPQFIEGRMNVGDRVTISIGDETWQNYSVSFDVDSLGYGQSIQMTIRDNRTSKLRYIQDNPYWWSGGWQYLNNSGEFVTIIDSGVGWQPRVELVVEDNFLYHTGPDGGTKTISNTYSDSGGFSLTLGVMWLDNLVVTRND